jgi:site-specific DNA-methyltransferase (adenine-specific)
MAEPTGNVRYYGDNLDVLRRHVPDESVDLIYLDPSSGVMGNASCTLAGCRGIQPSQRSMTSLA